MISRLAVYYRTWAGETETSLPRPVWFSKELCLKSFLLALAPLRDTMDVEMIVLHDGSLEPKDKWSGTLASLSQHLTTVALPKAGAAAACMDAVYRSAALPGDTLVIHAEDDHLWLPGALAVLVGAIESLPADYLIPFDSPLHYPPHNSLMPNFVRGHWHREVYVYGGRHWRPLESAGHIFAAQACTLTDDVMVFERHWDDGRSRDGELFRHLQGLGAYDGGDASGRRLLLGAIPSLVTHAHLPWLAPNINWDAVAAQLSAVPLRR
jgi:hypothetical protein